MDALVIGAGMAGLTSALALAAAGIQVTLFEAAAEIRPLGLGLNLQPYAVRELQELGLGEVVRARGREITSLHYFNRFGQPVHHDPVGLAAGYHWPQIAVHRGHLQATMLATFVARQGQARVRPGHRFVGLDVRSGQAVAFFERPDGTRAKASADFIVGADGVRSAVRHALFGLEDAPSYSGLTLWRAAVPFPKVLGGNAMIVAGHYAQRLVMYPIAAGTGDPENCLMNWIGVLQDGTADRAAEDWTAPGDPRHMLGAFADWRFDWLDVPAMMGKAESILRFPMIDRDAIPSWHAGNCVLVGDAAHPIYPVGSNGASHAILDGRALAYAVATGPDLETAFRLYEAERAPVLRNVLAANRAGGPDQILSVADTIAPNGFDDIDRQFPPAERREILDRYRSIAGFSPQRLNGRHSYSVGTGI